MAVPRCWCFCSCGDSPVLVLCPMEVSPKTAVFCSDFRVFFLLTARDYSHRKLWLPGWHRKQWRELSADSILMSSLASLLPKFTHMSKTSSSSPQKSYLHCCTKPERLRGTHFTGFWYTEFWKFIKKIWSQKVTIIVYILDSHCGHSVTLKNSANKWTDSAVVNYIVSLYSRIGLNALLSLRMTMLF